MVMYNRETGQPAQPLPTSKRVRLENWLRRHRLRFVADLLARWDERLL